MTSPVPSKKTPDSASLGHDGKTAKRRHLMALGPLAVIVIGCAWYVSTGRSISTENAYVKASKVAISSELAGTIAKVPLKENQAVDAGEVLFSLETDSFELGRQRAEANLAEVSTQILAMQAAYRQKQAELNQAREAEQFSKRELERQSRLAKRKMVAEGSFDAADHEHARASQQVAILKEDLARLLATLGGNAGAPVTDYAQYQAALAEVAQSKLNLEKTRIHAPFAGIASKVPQVGQYVSPGTPVMSIVASKDFWIEANFKETELTYIRPGQPVNITVDTYPDQRWQGQVQSISQASGAEFSVLPSQNASGNWVKVVQRIPVRISIIPNDDDFPLRAGMSAEISIDTGSNHHLPDFLQAFLKPAPASRDN